MWYFIDGAYARPCSGCGTPGCNGSCDPCSASPAQSDNMIYSGPNLPCTGIQTCDTITAAIQKIDAKICEIIDMIGNLTTTTTTTLYTGCVMEGVAIRI